MLLFGHDQRTKVQAECGCCCCCWLDDCHSLREQLRLHAPKHLARHVLEHGQAHKEAAGGQQRNTQVTEKNCMSDLGVRMWIEKGWGRRVACMRHVL
jgi:hypothetical protein